MAGTLSDKLKNALRQLDKAAGDEIKALLQTGKGRLAGATITIGDESTNVRAITVQLTDEDGNDLDHAAYVRLIVFADSGGAALATGGSTGIAIGTDGIIADTAVAKKVFDLVSESDGDIDLTWTDTGTEAVYLGLVMPNGKIVFSAVVQNAA